MKYQWWDNHGLDTFKLEIEKEVAEIAETTMNGISIWYPKKGYMTLYGDGGSLTKRELIVTDFVPNIDVDENMFRFDFPDGTEVYDRVRGISYIATSEESK